MKAISSKGSFSGKQKIITCAIVILMFIIGGSVYFYINQKQFESVKKNKATSRVGADTKENKVIRDNKATKNAAESDRPPEPKPLAGGSKSEVAIIVSAINQNGDMLQIRALIQAVVSDGDCKLNGTSVSGKTVQKIAGIQPQPSTSTCQGFDIPINELSQDKWYFTISFENSSLKGSVSKELVIN